MTITPMTAAEPPGIPGRFTFACRRLVHHDVLDDCPGVTTVSQLGNKTRQVRRTDGIWVQALEPRNAKSDHHPSTLNRSNALRLPTLSGNLETR